MAESDWDPAWQGLAASSEGDANQPEELNQWRKGPYGWLARCPRPYEQFSTIHIISRTHDTCMLFATRC